MSRDPSEVKQTSEDAVHIYYCAMQKLTESYLKWTLLPLPKVIRSHLHINLIPSLVIFTQRITIVNMMITCKALHWTPQDELKNLQLLTEALVSGIFSLF